MTGNNITPGKLTRVFVSFTPEEKAVVVARAKETRLSASELIRRTCLGLHIPSSEDFVFAESILRVVSVMGDQSRLSNLLKLLHSVAGEQLPSLSHTRIEILETDFARTKRKVAQTVEIIHFELHPRRLREHLPNSQPNRACESREIWT